MQIQFRKVTKTFGTVVALKDVEFKINPGEFVFLTGRSGAGKTTVIRLILGEYQPNRGEVKVGGVSVGKTKRGEVLKLRRQIGTIFQDFRLISDRTVFENVALPLEIKKTSKAQTRRLVEEALARVGLAAKGEFFPVQLAGGELQRVCLARALVVQPKLLLADEPTGNLDPQTGWELVKLLLKINKEKKVTVLMATHNFDIVNSLKKRVIKLEQGKVVSDVSEGKYQ